MKIVGVQKTTLVDYPGKIATTLFTLGCNMRCPYCHNKQIAFDFISKETIDVSEIYKFLESRRNFIDGIVITGGEPTLQPGLIDFMKEVKSRFGFFIKLDTNGSFPTVINRIIDENLADYYALDIKTSFLRYKEHLGVDGEVIKKTYELIRDSGKQYELRMTCYPEFINTDTVEELLPYLSERDRIFIQQCNLENDETITYNPAQLELFGERLNSRGMHNTKVRGLAV
jgi:pyruvate formate lyase activating enzyme